MMDLITAYIGFGSNQGDRNRSIQSAMEMLSHTPGVQIVRKSKVRETRALSASGDQPGYLNATVEIKTPLAPMTLFKTLQEVEIRLGRVRTEKWGPRTIDLDILLYGDTVISEPTLCVPHRQLHLRSFVLDGLAELCPEFVHPVLGRTMAELAKRLSGQSFAANPARPQLVSVAGLIGVGKTTLTRGLAECWGGKAVFEEYDKNPYLAKVYAGAKELALDSELYFLSSSVRQLSAETLTAGQIYVNDYVFEKARIYARSWLEAEQLAEYEAIYPERHKKAVLPTVVIYLEDSAEHCLERIHRRRRPFEQGIQTEFLKRLEGWYNDLFENWTACPLIRIRAEECQSPEQVRTLANEIRWYLATKENDKCGWFIP
jgi:2-amino-4-hydroxy-6-hydroxymethyldihydropteridine diphosphokinase